MDAVPHRIAKPIHSHPSIRLANANGELSGPLQREGLTTRRWAESGTKQVLRACHSHCLNPEHGCNTFFIYRFF